MANTEWIRKAIELIDEDNKFNYGIAEAARKELAELLETIDDLEKELKHAEDLISC